MWRNLKSNSARELHPLRLERWTVHSHRISIRSDSEVIIPLLWGRAWPDQDKVVILKRENDSYMVAHCGCLCELAFRLGFTIGIAMMNGTKLPIGLSYHCVEREPV